MVLPSSPAGPRSQPRAGIAGSLESWAVLSPFEWYLGNSPLLNGIDWTSVALFTLATALLVAAAVFAFERRDLRRR